MQISLLTLTFVEASRRPTLGPRWSKGLWNLTVSPDLFLNLFVTMFRFGLPQEFVHAKCTCNCCREILAMEKELHMKNQKKVLLEMETEVCFSEFIKSWALYWLCLGAWKKAGRKEESPEADYLGKCPPCADWKWFVLQRAFRPITHFYQIITCCNSNLCFLCISRFSRLRLDVSWCIRPVCKYSP